MTVPWFVKWTYRWENIQVWANISYVVACLSILVHLVTALSKATDKEEIALDAAFIAIDGGFLTSALGNFFVFGYFNCWVISAYRKLVATLA